MLLLRLGSTSGYDHFWTGNAEPDDEGLAMVDDIPEGLRNCANCAISEDWERAADTLHYVITKTCRACLLGTLHKSLPYPFKGWLPQYKAGIYRWMKQASGDVCPKDGTPVRLLRHGDTCKGCYYGGKMSYVSGDSMLTTRCHYVLARNCSNCKHIELRPISKKCDGCIGQHNWTDPKPPLSLEMTP